MIDIVMPFVSETMEEGTIQRWLKAVGDRVAIGDELCQIDAGKAIFVHVADEAGVLAEILVPEGGTVPSGAVIARLSDGTSS